MAEPAAEKIVWKAVTVAVGMVAGAVAERVLTGAWRALASGANPPSDAGDRRRPVVDAVVWGATVGAVAGAIRVGGTRSAARAWEAATDNLPPGTRR